MTNPHPSADSAAHDIVSERVLDAPREAVFAAFTDPGVLAGWWGPKGFTNDFDVCEPWTGGAWRFTMRAPDGAGYAMEKRFAEVAPPERIVVDHIQAGHDHRMTMTFEDEGGKRTRLRWRMRFESAEEEERVRPFVVAANEENFDRLEAALG
ncbi:MAG TPA: SRPBCC domain-containing protein [Longimicrobium sp.]|nr:SRPBCC domain-containing protein [Longimicrobium sp.]